MNRNVIIIVIFFTLLLFGKVSATNYFFSTVNGNDSNSGLTESSPKFSLTEIQKTLLVLNAGDTIFFERGSIWYQTMLFISGRSGTAENPIVFDTYGSGENPVFSGQRILSSPVQNGNIYTFTDTAIPFVYLMNKSYGRRVLGYVTIGGKPYAPSRHPNQGYYTSTSSNRIGLTDTKQTWEDNQWKDGWIAVKSQNWQWSLARVTSNNLNTLATTEHAPYAPFGARPFFFINSFSALDSDGEWYFSDNKLSVFWTDGELPEVKVPVVDQIFNINNSNYIHYNNIDFIGANYYCVKLTKSDYNRFNRCRIIGAGEFGIRIYGAPGSPGQAGDSESNEIVYSEIADCGLGGIFTRYARGGTFSNNYIHRIAIYPGFQNKNEDNSVDGYSIAVWNNIATDNMPVVKQNFIDSVQAGITNHYNGSEFLMTENFIRNYGMGDLSDLGGLYIVSDTYATNKNRKITKNFFIDVHQPHPESQDNNYSDSYIHAVYFDQDSYQVKADSNSIENAQIALMTNGGKFRTFNHNNILYPVSHKSMIKEHRAAIANNYVIPLNGGGKAESDTFIYNNVVFGNYKEVGYKFSRTGGTYGCLLPYKGRIDYNKWFDPSGTSPIIAAIYETYSPQYSYTLNQWQELTSNCSDVINDPGDSSTYNNKNYNEIRLFKNWSPEKHTFYLDAIYENISGEQVNDSIEVAAFYSTILFQISGEEKRSDLFIDSTLIPEPFATAPATPIITSTGKNFVITPDIIYFPNPVSEVLNLANLPMKCTLSIFNITGKLIKAMSCSGETVEVDMADLKEGIYLLKIGGISQTKCFKIIKQ